MDNTTLFPHFTQTPPDDGHSLNGNDIVNIVMYCVIGLFGIVGNTLVMIVFGLLTQQKSQVNMFIFNQALVDCCTSVLLILFGMINVFRPKIMAYTVDDVADIGNSAEYDYTASANMTTMSTPSGHFTYLSTSMAEFLCRFWWSRFFLFACFAISTFNLTVMSIERYFAVIHPITYTRNFSKRRALIMIVLTWLISPIMQYFPAIFMYTCGPGECIIQTSWTLASGAVLGVFLFVWEFVLPVCIMGFVYYNIISEMRKKKHALQTRKPLDPPSATSTPTRTLKNKSTSKIVHPSRNITMTLCILFAVYVICWTPNQITFLQFNLGGPLNFSGAWYHITVTMAFLNCCVNPFIYALRLRKFKKGMKMFIHCQWHRRSTEQARITESTSMGGLSSNQL